MRYTVYWTQTGRFVSDCRSYVEADTPNDAAALALDAGGPDWEMFEQFPDDYTIDLVVPTDDEV